MKKVLLTGILSLFSFSIWADDSGTCSYNLTWNYDDATETLTISGSGRMADFSSASVPWYTYKDFIKIVIIEDGVTSIGINSFNGFRSLTSIEIPNSVTSIGRVAFCGCTGLTSITIPNSVTYIGSSTFRGCTGLTSVTIGNSVKSIGDYTFENCGSLTSITIPNSVTSIGDHTFDGCTGLTSVTIGNSVTSIGSYAFDGCTGLTSVTIGNSVTSIGFCAFAGCTHLTSIELPNSVTSIGEYAFEGCTGLTSITIPNSVTSIDGGAFYGCSGLTSVTIPNSVTSIAGSPFLHCTRLTSILVEAGNKKYDSRDNCNAIIETSTNTLIAGCKKTTIPNSVTSIDGGAFYGCTGLTSVTIPNNVTSIGEFAFYGCTGLTSIEFPNSVTSIGESAFEGCTGLTSVIFGKNVSSIGSDAFTGCNNLDVKVKVTDYSAFCNNKSVGSVFAYFIKSVQLIDAEGKEITKYHVPDNVTSIGEKAFYHCTDLISVTIGSNVATIGSQAFEGCYNLTDVKVKVANYSAFCNNKIVSSINPNNNYYYSSIPIHLIDQEGIEINEYVIPDDVTGIGDKAFYLCTGLTSVTLGKNVATIGAGAFSRCSGLSTLMLKSNAIVSKSYTSSSNLKSIFGNQVKDITIGDEVTSIGNYAFYDFQNVLSVDIPESVEKIGEYSFLYCGFTSIDLHDNIKSIGNNAFSCKLFVNRGSKTLLACWNSKNLYTVPYDKETDKGIPAPSINGTETTQTTATVRIDNWYDGYDYLYNGEAINGIEQYHTHIKPELTQQVSLDVSKDDVHYTTTGQFTTKSLAPTIGSNETTASSISALGSYTMGDAQVVAQRIAFSDNEAVEGNHVFTSGLDPDTEYDVRYTIDVDYGGTETATYSGTTKIRTQSLQLETTQPKVVSVGDVIVTSTTNLDDAEANVGIEWRRTDWTDEFQSNKGQGYIYDGIIEGIIRNLYTEKLWKVRPYYLSDSGNYYCGEWMGVDPTNTSYYEPTVHTDSRIIVQDNTAEVRGYAMRGTYNVAKQGFAYWKTSSQYNGTVPADATIVEASGVMMSAMITGLNYGTEYGLTAFVTTSEGETFYGEQQSFKTEGTPTSVEELQVTPKVMEEMRFDLQGHRLDTPKKGLNIIRMSDGTIKKVVVK